MLTCLTASPGIQNTPCTCSKHTVSHTVDRAGDCRPTSRGVEENLGPCDNSYRSDKVNWCHSWQDPGSVSSPEDTESSGPRPHSSLAEQLWAASRIDTEELICCIY